MSRGVGGLASPGAAGANLVAAPEGGALVANAVVCARERNSASA